METASALVAAAYESSRDAMTEQELHAERREILRLAAEESVRKGVTTFQDAGVGPATLALYREAIDEGGIPEVARELRGDRADESVRIGERGPDLGHRFRALEADPGREGRRPYVSGGIPKGGSSVKTITAMVATSAPVNAPVPLVRRQSIPRRKRPRIPPAK